MILLTCVSKSRRTYTETDRHALFAFLMENKIMEANQKSNHTKIVPPVFLKRGFLILGLSEGRRQKIKV